MTPAAGQTGAAGNDPGSGINSGVAGGGAGQVSGNGTGSSGTTLTGESSTRTTIRGETRRPSPLVDLTQPGRERRHEMGNSGNWNRGCSGQRRYGELQLRMQTISPGRLTRSFR